MSDTTSAETVDKRAISPRRPRHHAAARRHRASARHHGDPRDPHFAAAADVARLRAGGLDHVRRPDPDDVAVHPNAARILGVSDHPTDLDHAAAVAQSRLDAIDPGAWSRRHVRCRPRHRGVRQFRHERQFRDRHRRLPDPGHHQFCRHHQRRGPHRRSRGAVPLGRHARQADGDRRRSQCRPDQRQGSTAAAQNARRRIRFLRRHGRCLQIRPRRRHRRAPGRHDQYHRRHGHRHRAGRPELRRSRPHLYAAHRRRRPRHPDSGADRLDRRRPSGVESGRQRRRRQSAARPALRLSQGARHVGRRRCWSWRCCRAFR